MNPRAGYSTAQVAALLSLPPRRVRSFVRAGFLTPHRHGRAYRFSFQDLVILRAAKELADAGIAAGRVSAALARLREQLPRGRSLAAVRITAEAGRVVARDGREVWEPATGQRPLPYPALDDFAGFEVAELARRAEPLGRRALAEAEAREEELDAEDWYELGFELEASAPREAERAYRRALDLDAGHADAHVNLGRLLHERGAAAGDDRDTSALAAAEEHYRHAAGLRPRDATAWFNLGVVLEDLERPEESAAAYERSLAVDPTLADAHYNLAGLMARRGDEAAALRHLAAYKRLSKA